MTDVTPLPPPLPYPPPPHASGPFPPRPRVWAVPAVVDPAPGRLVGYALGTALLLEIGLRGGADNLVVTAGVVMAVVALLADGRLQRAQARMLALVALVPAAFLAVRASPWLMVSNLAVVAAFLGAAVLYSRSGSVFDATPGGLLQRAGAATDRAIAGQAVVAAIVPRLSAGDQRRAVRLGTALLVSVPVLALLVALLASADAVFASLLTPDADMGPLGGHVVLTLVLVPLVLGLAGAATSALDDRRRHGGFGVAEVATMLGLAALVLGLFAVSQLVALTGAGERLVTEAGLTPAEYARSGFFQLCWATGVMLGFLVVVRALAAPAALDHRAVRILGTAVPGLALGLVAVSLRRMALYDEAFGLTMLRLWVVGAAIWMGCVLVMTAARNAGCHSGGRWLVAGAGIAALVLVVGADVLNAEAFVARHNIARGRDGAQLDAGYLVELSDDAVPTLANDAVLSQLLPCSGDRQGVAALNLAAARAADSRREVCANP
jgi:hypothetical protein